MKKWTVLCYGCAPWLVGYLLGLLGLDENFVGLGLIHGLMLLFWIWLSGVAWKQLGSWKSAVLWLNLPAMVLSLGTFLCMGSSMGFWGDLFIVPGDVFFLPIHWLGHLFTPWCQLAYVLSAAMMVGVSALTCELLEKKKKAA